MCAPLRCRDSRAQVDDAVLEFQLPQEGLGPSHHVGVLGDCSALAKTKRSTLSNSCTRSRPRVCCDPAEPASRRVTGGAGRQPDGEVGLLEDLVVEHRRQRHLGSGDGPQVVALEVIGIVGEALLGRCPVEIMVSVRTSVGGRTSS